MKRIFTGFIIGLSAFFAGISIARMFYFPPNPVVENLILVEENARFDLPEIEPNKISEKKDLFPPGSDYRFPRSGLYFSTEKDKDEQSIFTIGLTYETHYLPRKIRGVKREVEVLISEADWVYDQRREFKRSSVKINGDKIVLKTSRVKDVEYKFEGTFIDQKHFERDFYDRIVLKGILQKFVRGKRVFEKKIEFTYEVGC